MMRFLSPRLGESGSANRHTTTCEFRTILGVPIVHLWKHKVPGYLLPSHQGIFYVSEISFQHDAICWAPWGTPVENTRGIILILYLVLLRVSELGNTTTMLVTLWAAWLKPKSMFICCCREVGRRGVKGLRWIGGSGSCTSSSCCTFRWLPEVREVRSGFCCHFCSCSYSIS